MLRYRVGFFKVFYFSFFNECNWFDIRKCFKIKVNVFKYVSNSQYTTTFIGQYTFKFKYSNNGYILVRLFIRKSLSV